MTTYCCHGYTRSLDRPEVASRIGITTPELDLSGGITYSGTNPNKATVTNFLAQRILETAGKSN